MSLHSQTLTRACLKEAMHSHLGFTLDQAGVLLESILEEMTSLIIQSSYLKIISFGTFLIHDKKARIGRNPKTKEEVIITPRKSVSFRASLLLRKKVNEKK